MLIWSNRYDRELSDIFDIQDEISEQVAGEIEPEVSLAEIRKALAKPEQDLDAWDCVMKALALKSEYTEAGSVQAIKVLEDAIDIDPTYARAHGLLGWVLIWRVHQGWEEIEPTLARAKLAADTALRYDTNEIWAYVAQGFVASVTKDDQMLIEAMKRAIEINPSFALVHSWMGAALAITGRGEEAFAHIDRARRLSPRDMLKEEFDLHESFAFLQTGDYAKAYLAAHKTMVVQPHHIYPRLIMTSALGLQGKQPEAVEELARIAELVPDVSLALVEASSVFCDEDLVQRFISGLEVAGLT